MGDGEGQGGLLCCGPRGRKESEESDKTERPNNNLSIVSHTILLAHDGY